MSIRAHVQQLQEFLSDGCTLAPDFDFYGCCEQHDLDYSGMSIPRVSRSEADARLRRCIKAKGHPVLCWIYWAGVRVFGGSRYALPSPEGPKVTT